MKKGSVVEYQTWNQMNIDDYFSNIDFTTTYRKNMKVVLQPSYTGRTVYDNVGSKVGDVVTVISVHFPNNDEYERIRVSNGKFTWRVERALIKPVKPSK